MGFALYAAELSAQNTTFKFYDVQTGFSIAPEKVNLYSDTGELKNSFEKKNLVRGKAIELDLKKGNYNVAISKSGYKTMDVDFTTTKDKRINKKMMLSPKKLPKEVTAEYLRSLHRPDRTMVTGYVADDKGMPVVDALLQSDDGATARTDKKGYFQLSLSYDKEEFYDVQLKAFNITKPGFKTERREQVVVIPNGDALYRIQLEPGSGETVNQMSDFIIENGKIVGRFEDQLPTLDEPFEPMQKNGQHKSASQCLPQFITVGYLNETNHKVYCCPFTVNPIDCEDEVTLELEEYVKRVIKNEWLSGWSNLNNIGEAYKAAAVAIRTFGAYRVLVDPREGSHDITDSPCDQVYTPGTTSWSISAGEGTKGVILKVNGNILKAEYSSENNNRSGNHCLLDDPVIDAGCNDGQFKDGITGQCIDDPLGAGKIQFGHGRNMSQFGGARWASGLALGDWCVGSATSGAPHHRGTKNWEQIIAMYYPSHDLINCNGNTGGDSEDCSILNFNNYTVSGYGYGVNNDYQDGGTAQKHDGGNTLEIKNNAWKKIEVNYNVTSNTVLSFDFKSTKQGEIHGIGFDDNMNIEQLKTFRVHGTQHWWGRDDYDTYSGNGAYQQFTIPVGRFYTGQFRYLFFLADHDNAPGNGDSFFSNIQIYEDTNGNRQCDGTIEPPTSSTCEELSNSTFDSNANDWQKWRCNTSVSDGILNITNITGGTTTWNAGFKQNSISLDQDKTYTLSMSARADNNRSVVLRVMLDQSPWTQYIQKTISLNAGAMQTHTFDFTVNTANTTKAKVELMLGGSNTNVRVDHISLEAACNNKEDASSAPDIRLYPNPATHTISVEYELPKSTLANIAVFDAFGKLVKNIADTELLAGTQILNMDVSDLAAGMYFCTLQANEWKTAKKFIIVK